MPDPVPMIELPLQQQIIDDIVAAINEILPDNGYQSSLTATRLKPGVGEGDFDGKVVIYCAGQSPAIQGAAARETQADTLWRMRVSIEVTAVIADPGASEEPVDRRAWIMWADVYKRLCQVDPQLKSVQYIYPTDPTCVVDPSAAIAYLEDVFTVHYQHASGNPYSA